MSYGAAPSRSGSQPFCTPLGNPRGFHSCWCGDTRLCAGLGERALPRRLLPFIKLYANAFHRAQLTAPFSEEWRCCSERGRNPGCFPHSIQLLFLPCTDATEISAHTQPCCPQSSPIPFYTSFITSVSSRCHISKCDPQILPGAGPQGASIPRCTSCCILPFPSSHSKAPLCPPPLALSPSEQWRWTHPHNPVLHCVAPCFLMALMLPFTLRGGQQLFKSLLVGICFPHSLLCSW